MKTVSSVSLTTLTENDIVHYLIRNAEEQEQPVAYWKLPGTTTRYLVLSNICQQLDHGSAIEELANGFLFAPFDKNKKPFYLPADYLFRFENGSLAGSNSPVETHSSAWLQSKMEALTSYKKMPLRGRSIKSSSSAADFLATVEKAIKSIEENAFEKVVVSRTKEVSLKEDFDIVDTFEKLGERYPNALVSFVSIPGVGTWMGATPESLVSVINQTTFKTVALAGTLPYHEGINLKSVAWTQKEIEEQALVERYIISCFKKIRLREYEEHGPKTMIAGNLMHLRSDFMVDMKATNFLQLGTVMLQLLHPTSAVCGMPLEPALAFINTHEGYDREFYAGYLGPVNISNDTHLYVNLRCMKLMDTTALLYAGAGITVDSIPEKEREETEMKFNTIHSVLS